MKQQDSLRVPPEAGTQEPGTPEAGTPESGGVGTTVLPTFIIGGAPKCGTTALWAYLDEHPDVCMASIKEPRFFTQASGSLETPLKGDGPRLSGTYERGFGWYASLFSTPDAPARGEASTVYLATADAASLIAQHVPEVKLIFLLRDPVARLYSHYWQEHKLGFDFPSFETMLREDHPRFRFYCESSAYGRTLERFYSRFPAEQILLLLDEDLKAQPRETLSQVYRFIGVPDFVPPSLGKRFNEQTTPRRRGLQRFVSVLQSSSLARKLPPVWRRQLGKLRAGISKLNTVTHAYPPLSDALRRDLLKRLETDIAFVETRLGRDLSHWRRGTP